MKNHNSEKYALEDAALEIFLKIYNNNNQNNLQIHTRQERPDVILIDSIKELIGLEITHLFFDSKEAKMLLGRDDDRFHGNERFSDLIGTLNELIKQKVDIYDNIEFTHDIALLVRNASPIFGTSDFLREKHLIIKQKVFKNIWFLSRDGYDEWLMKDLMKV